MEYKEITHVHNELQSAQGKQKSEGKWVERTHRLCILLHYRTGVVPWWKLSSSSASSIFTPGPIASVGLTAIFSLS